MWSVECGINYACILELLIPQVHTIILETVIELPSHCRLPYGSIFGGICAIRTEQFVAINGFSNSYWGWGGEDDDLSMR